MHHFPRIPGLSPHAFALQVLCDHYSTSRTAQSRQTFERHLVNAHMGGDKFYVILDVNASVVGPSRTAPDRTMSALQKGHWRFVWCTCTIPQRLGFVCSCMVAVCRTFSVCLAQPEAQPVSRTSSNSGAVRSSNLLLNSSEPRGLAALLEPVVHEHWRLQTDRQHYLADTRLLSLKAKLRDAASASLNVSLLRAATSESSTLEDGEIGEKEEKARELHAVLQRDEIFSMVAEMASEAALAAANQSNDRVLELCHALIPFADPDRAEERQKRLDAATSDTAAVRKRLAVATSETTAVPQYAIATTHDRSRRVSAGLFAVMPDSVQPPRRKGGGKKRAATSDL